MNTRKNNGAASEAPAADPTTAALNAEIAALKKQIQGLKLSQGPKVKAPATVNDCANLGDLAAYITAHGNLKQPLTSGQKFLINAQLQQFKK